MGDGRSGLEKRFASECSIALLLEHFLILLITFPKEYFSNIEVDVLTFYVSIPTLTFNFLI